MKSNLSYLLQSMELQRAGYDLGTEQQKQFIFFFLNFLCFGVIAKKSLPNLKSWKFTPIFPKGFIALALAFRSLIHFELVVVCAVK